MLVGSWIRGPLAGGHSWPCQVSRMQNQAREPQVATGVLLTAPKAGRGLPDFMPEPRGAGQPFGPCEKGRSRRRCLSADGACAFGLGGPPRQACMTCPVVQGVVTAVPGFHG